ncbi:fungal-specific transcription factor domain-containing protein [Phanerochaete sordida]|uniref:Fungal-specific transcription factor domain-containing protein n=1 Tax=Phanerochaete sordida TaxID=48140 RepID=A0A9P3G5J1_9APHY|nr:fungal-specific transcription factor domain-containing protein [Phanerochaete sordida]
MSSEEDDVSRTGDKSRKKRRIGRACDMCRQKKVRCDGDEGRRCTNCMTFDDECTYVHTAPKRRTRPKGYVERLEQRASQLEELLNKLCPGFDLLEGFGQAVEESSKINAEQESDEEDEIAAGLKRSLSDGPDFSHAIPPSLGSPPIRVATSSNSILSAVPIASSSTQHLQSRSPSLEMAADPEDLLPSDDELTMRDSLSQRFTQMRQEMRFSDAEGDVESPMSAEPLDFDTPGPSRAHSRSMSIPGSFTRRPSMPPMTQTALTAWAIDRRFFGKSSNFSMLRTAVDMKSEYWRAAGAAEGTPRDMDCDSPQSPLEAHSPHTAGVGEKDDREAQPALLPCGCPNYGAHHPWARALPRPAFVFPHAALLRALVGTYFDVQNTYVPVLHRPALEAGLAAGRHRADEDFGALVLLVCALGARWATDRTVLLGVGDAAGRAPHLRDAHAHGAHGATAAAGALGPESVQDDFWREGEDDEEWHSAGWKWFKQVRFGRKALYGAPNLLDLQGACLASMYLRGSSSPEASRWITGVGLRLGMDMGAHRRKTYGAVPTAEEEQLKRAFWSLVYLDWTISPSLGRPCAIQHEDFDLDLPVECDDEYWEPSAPSAPRFSQPAGKPAAVVAFNCMLRLTQIQAYAQRTIYSTTKSRTILGFVGPQWEERIVAELDSALNSWLDSLPPHLKWDARNPNTTFLSQSAVLHAAFYNLQITIHRPFIASRRRLSPAAFPPLAPAARFPSLAICTNAARTCVHVSDVLCRRLGQGSHSSLGVLHHNMMPLFTSGIVLMLNMWAGNDKRRHAGERSTVKEMKEMADVHKAMDMLKVMEVRWHTAGRLWDMLYELAVVWDLPLPSSSHAAVIRSIKQHRGPARARPIDPAPTAPPPPPQRRATVSVGALHRRAASPPSADDAPAPPRAPAYDLDVYRADPVAPWLEYDLSPSVFSQPRAAPDAQDAPPPDPALDSVFALRTHKARAHPPAFASNVDFGAAPPAGAPAPAPPPVPRAVFPQDRRPPPPPAARDTIAQVLDTIQSRQADWAVPPQLQSQPQPQQQQTQPQPQTQQQQAQTHEWPVPGSASVDAFPPMPARAAQPAEPQAAGAGQEWAMWQSVPEGFQWDEWGSYIDAMGAGYPGADPGPAGMADVAGGGGEAFEAALRNAGYVPP